MANFVRPPISASAYEKMVGARVETELPAEDLFVMEELRKNPQADEKVLRQIFRLREGTLQNPAKAPNPNEASFKFRGTGVRGRI